MTATDLSQLLDNMDAAQLKMAAEILARLALIKQERFTGQVIITLHSNNGGLGNGSICRNEIVRVKGV